MQKWTGRNGSLDARRGCMHSGPGCDVNSAMKSPPSCTVTGDGSSSNPSARLSSGFVRASPTRKRGAMLADVRVMCIDGRRVPRERLKSMQPVRGELSVTRRRDRSRDEWVPMAVLRSESTKELPALDQVRISRWFCGLRPGAGKVRGLKASRPSCWRRPKTEPQMRVVPTQN